MLSPPAAVQRSRWFANRDSTTAHSGATKPLIRQSLRLRSSQLCAHDNKQRPDLFLGWLNFPGKRKLTQVEKFERDCGSAATIEENSIIKEWEF